MERIVTREDSIDPLELDTVPEVEHEDDGSATLLLTDRAISLWRHLTAAPPLHPPDWKRSRIRRLFLVSLGIPIDLDEILPPHKTKKLILTPQKAKATGGRDTPQEHTSRFRDIPPPPEFEVFAARQLCSTSEGKIYRISHKC